ncbi:MAG: hypothetical protein ABIR91_00965 [Candidatus Saccharimonadales bacterium]
MKKDFFTITSPIDYLYYPYAYIVPLGLLVALGIFCYFMGAKKPQLARKRALMVVVATVALYSVIRLVLPFPVFF